ncbi:hypothetical protein SAY86_029541 [Trapa natans]|uniref:Bromo domain-containing protein n=1 Tax=Trapa natans TaxID=22666 RepID=A0AAN7MHR7_TRANT|nr:hypothetical protein SAY86_029541 [Trapa natans]
MGKGAQTTNKKKGRPSLLDIQKRILKQQKLQEALTGSPDPRQPSDGAPNPNRRSARRNHSSDGPYPSSEWVSGGDDDDDERIRKKRKPLFVLDPQCPNSSVEPPPTSSGSPGTLYSNPRGDKHDPDSERRKGENVLKGIGAGRQGAEDVSGPTTPLPDTKLLDFILYRLQKKDTHGVFSEPVDPEELPDYHDIIKHPMDLGTVRKKLEGGAYANLEQFEKDVFLICSNAMQYNSPDTIFFRQARSMQELAKKDFENLRQESDGSEPEQTKIVRRVRPPGKGLKKLLEKTSADCTTGPEVSTDTVLANGASVLRSVMKEGKKLSPSDENKRDSYKQKSAGQEHSLLCTFGSERKYLTVVDLQSQDHGYARSLARFAANLGPAVWKIASKKIQSILPSGTNFGPGWVGEEEILNMSLSRNPPPSTSSPTPTPTALNSATGDVQSTRRLASQDRLTSPSSSSSELKPISQEAGMYCTSGNMGTVMQTAPSPLPAPREVPVHPEEPSAMFSPNLGTFQMVPSNYV